MEDIFNHHIALDQTTILFSWPKCGDIHVNTERSIGPATETLKDVADHCYSPKNAPSLKLARLSSGRFGRSQPQGPHTPCCSTRPNTTGPPLLKGSLQAFQVRRHCIQTSSMRPWRSKHLAPWSFPGTVQRGLRCIPRCRPNWGIWCSPGWRNQIC